MDGSAESPLNRVYLITFWSTGDTQMKTIFGAEPGGNPFPSLIVQAVLKVNSSTHIPEVANRTGFLSNTPNKSLQGLLADLMCSLSTAALLNWQRTICT